VAPLASCITPVDAGAAVVQHGDVQALQARQQAPLQRRAGGLGQQRRLPRHQRDAAAVRRCHRVRRGHGQLDRRHVVAHHGHLQGALGGQRPQLRPQLHEGFQRVGEQRIGARAGHGLLDALALHRRLQVDRQHVVGQGVAAGQLHAAAVGVERDDVRRHEGGAAALDQAVDGHAQLVQRAVAGHVGGSMALSM
jgi:hypothetical protein